VSADNVAAAGVQQSQHPLGNEFADLLPRIGSSSSSSAGSSGHSNVGPVQQRALRLETIARGVKGREAVKGVAQAAAEVTAAWQNSSGVAASIVSTIMCPQALRGHVMRAAQTGHLAACQLAFSRLRAELGVGIRLGATDVQRLSDGQREQLVVAAAQFEEALGSATAAAVARPDMPLAALEGAAVSAEARAGQSGCSCQRPVLDLKWGEAAVQLPSAATGLPALRPLAAAVSKRARQGRRGRGTQQLSTGALWRRRLPVYQQVLVQGQGRHAMHAAVDRVRHLPDLATSLLRQQHAAAVAASPGQGLLKVVEAVVADSQVLMSADAAEPSVLDGDTAERPAKKARKADALPGTCYSEARAGHGQGFAAYVSGGRGRIAGSDGFSVACSGLLLEFVEGRPLREPAALSVLLPDAGLQQQYVAAVKECDAADKQAAADDAAAPQQQLSELRLHAADHSAERDAWVASVVAVLPAWAGYPDGCAVLRHMVNSKHAAWRLETVKRVLRWVVPLDFVLQGFVPNNNVLEVAEVQLEPRVYGGWGMYDWIGTKCMMCLAGPRIHYLIMVHYVFVLRWLLDLQL